MSDQPHKRPSWDDYFMGITLQVATRSTCDRARVGAIIVKDRRTLHHRLQRLAGRAAALRRDRPPDG